MRNLANLFSPKPTKDKGPTPGDVRPRLYAMTNIAHAVLPGNRNPITPLPWLVQGKVRVDRLRGEAILRHAYFKPQEGRTGTQYLPTGDLRTSPHTAAGRQACERIAHLVRTPGAWHPQLHPVTVARLSDGSWHWLNGYHRVYTAVMCGVDVELFVNVVFVQSKAELGALYATFDQKGTQRPRGAAQIIEASGIAQNNGISRHTARALHDAVPIIARRFSTSVHDRDHMLNLPDMRLNAMRTYLAEARLFSDIAKGCPAIIGDKLRRGGPCAVALVTLKHDRDRAVAFWSGVANNDGLRRGDPRQAYLTALLSRDANSGLAHASYAMPAIGWNSFRKGASRSIIKVLDVDRVKINGTPFA